MKKTILFDLSASQPITDNDFHGGGEYAKTVFYRLCESLPAGASLEVFFNPQKNIEVSLPEICKAKGITVNYCRNNAEITALLAAKKYDVFYSALPYSYSKLVIPPETKFIYTFHGLRALEYPVDKYEFKYRKPTLKTIARYIINSLFPGLWKKYQIKKLNRLFLLTNNQHIITVSNHSKFALAYFFPKLNIDEIKVFYSPLKSYESGNVENNNIFNSLLTEPGKYILLIGGDRSEKGAYRACKVLYTLIKRHKGIPNDIKILVLGVTRFGSYRRLTKNSRRFIFRGYVSDGELETLYKNAHLFLYPTLNEGFGYPPLEAMKYGTPCACSANSAITEIYGDSVLYFNPFDETEMGIRILQSFDEGIRREKIEKITLHYRITAQKQKQDIDLLIQEVVS